MIVRFFYILAVIASFGWRSSRADSGVERREPLDFIDWSSPRDNNPSAPEQFILEMIAVARSGEVRRAFVERGRDLSRDILASAFHHPNATRFEKEIFSSIWNRLERVRIEFPRPGQEFNYCTEKTDSKGELVGFAQNGVVYLCSNLLTPAKSRQEIADWIIHETNHVTHPSFSECEVSAIQFTAMRFAGYPVRTNWYVRSKTCPTLRTSSRIESQR